MTEETKSKVLKVFEETYPQDLSIVEASRRAGISDPSDERNLGLIIERE